MPKRKQADPRAASALYPGKGRSQTNTGFLPPAGRAPHVFSKKKAFLR
jgi:hypothetical protein